jgi:two-component system phosphate regulon sensor histidine kinase PhoR
VRSSLRNRLLFTFLVLVIVVGAGTLFAIERTLADDLVTELDDRMTKQGGAVANWLTGAGHPDKLAPRLAGVTRTRITIIGADGLIQGDSYDKELVGQPIGDADEVTKARSGESGRAIRQLAPDEPPQYLVAVPGDLGRVIRLAVPLGVVLETRARMRNRLIVGAGFGFLGCLLLSWIFVRALTRPIQSMTRTAERLSAGDYDAPPPIDSGGELGVLAHTMMKMAGDIKTRIDALTHQRDLLSVIINGLVEGVVVVDRANNIMLINDAARPLLTVEDRDPSASMSMSRRTIELPPALETLIVHAKAGYPAEEEEVELVGRTVRASARPLAQSSRHVHDAAAIVVLYDVTRMRALEAVRREFLSNAAHELRTPITSISGYAETLLSGGVDGETSKEFLTVIHRNSQRIAGLVSDLLVLDQLGGRAEAVADRVPIQIAEVAQDAARTAKGVTPTAQIEIAVAPALTVLATRDGLDHVVQNLVDNAVKYGSGTPITISADRIEDRVQIAIADRGSGIPKGMEERIFERFYRLDSGRSRDQGGSGLGLAIVKNWVEAMGGRVWVEDASPGARFVVELDAPTASA